SSTTGDWRRSPPAAATIFATRAWMTTIRTCRATCRQSAICSTCSIFAKATHSVRSSYARHQASVDNAQRLIRSERAHRSESPGLDTLNPGLVRTVTSACVLDRGARGGASTQHPTLLLFRLLQSDDGQPIFPALQMRCPAPVFRTSLPPQQSEML